MTAEAAVFSRMQQKLEISRGSKQKKGTVPTMHSEIVGLCHRDCLGARNINDLIEKLDKFEKNWPSEAIKHNSYDATCGAGRPEVLLLEAQR